MAAANKFLAVVIDGTIAMGPYWITILSEYLEKIIRHMFEQSSDRAALHLSLIQYNAHGLGNPGCLVQTSPWTKDVEGFLGRLSALRFCGGGGRNDAAAVAEALAEALLMFSKTTPTFAETYGQAHQGHFERHCILLAASNPILVPTRVQVPIISDRKFCGTEVQFSTTDAKTVAGLYAKTSVSLSVIARKQFQELREIYNAGNVDLEGPPSFSDANNPDLLLLLSTKFLEAQTALLKYADCFTGFIPEQDNDLLRDLWNGPETHEHDQNEHSALKDTEDRYYEIQMMGSVAGGSSPERQWWLDLYGEEEPVLQNVPGSDMNTYSNRNLVSASPLSVSEKLEMEATTQAVQPFLAPEAVETAMLDASVPYCSAHSGQQLVTAPAVSEVDGLELSQKDRRSSHTATSASSVASRISSAESNVTRTPSRTRIPLPDTTTPCQVRRSPRIGQGGPITSASPPRVPARRGRKPRAASTGTKWEASDHMQQDKWEGRIFAKYQGQVVVLKKLKVYKRASVPDGLTADWPGLLHWGNFIPQAAISTSLYEEAHNILFVVTSKHDNMHDILRKNNMCLVIGLPSQTLVMTPAEDTHFVGRVYAGHGVLQYLVQLHGTNE